MVQKYKNNLKRARKINKNYGISLILSNFATKIKLISSMNIFKRLFFLCVGMLTWEGFVTTVYAVSPEDGSVTIQSAQAEFNVTEVDFGQVTIGGTYTKSVIVTNVGNADLVISYLYFSDVMAFSSTTELPLTISPGDSEELNITYAPVNRGSIERTLTIFSNSISDQNKIKLKAQPYSVNELHVQPVSGFYSEEVTISMTMNNMDPVSGYQVEFEIPEQLEFVTGSFTLSSRKQDHSSAVSMNNNVLRIIVYSQSDKPLTGNEGEIGSFKVKLVGKSSVELLPSKTVLSATINHVIENVVSNVYGGLITIKTQVKPGDTNGDDKVDYRDIDTMIDYIMKGKTEKFIFKNADINEDGEVNTVDIVLIVSIIKKNLQKE